jgi:uncharacterized protein YybS (DUF2232 family)
MKSIPGAIKPLNFAVRRQELGPSGTREGFFVEVNGGLRAPLFQPTGSPCQLRLTRRDLIVGIAGTLFAFFAVFTVPVVGIFIGIFTPLPTLLSVYRCGHPAGYWVPAGAMVVSVPLLFYLELTPNSAYLLGMLVLGALVAEAMCRQWSVEATVGIAGSVVFVGAALAFWAANEGFGGRFTATLTEELRAGVAATLQYYESIGVSFDKAAMQQGIERLIPLFVSILPGAALASALLVTWLNVLVARRFCLLHRVPLPTWQPWSLWKAPEPLVWLVIAGGGLLLLPVKAAGTLGLNLLLVLGTVYLLQGLAIAVFYFDRWRVPRLLRSIMYALILLQQFATLLLMLLGLFDVWCNFRRLPPPGTPTQQSV